MELIPHLFGANRRPTGQRGLWMWARYGADSINDSAFRMLQAQNDFRMMLPKALCGAVCGRSDQRRYHCRRNVGELDAIHPQGH